jgi:hypothetical protein
MRLPSGSRSEAHALADWLRGHGAKTAAELR